MISENNNKLGRDEAELKLMNFWPKPDAFHHADHEVAPGEKSSKTHTQM